MARVAGIILLVCWSLEAQHLVYPLPAETDLEWRRGLTYRTLNGVETVMDVVLPVKRQRTAPLPVLVFMNAFGGDSTRTSIQYKDWMKLAAGNGFVAITPDTHLEGVGDDLDQITDYVRRHALDLSADPAQIGVWACSGHAYGTLPLVEDAARTAIKSAVMYYGGEAVPVFRLDLPVMLVRAGLDRPIVNRRLDEIAANAVMANAPVTLLNYAGGHHGFDTIDDNDATRAVIVETLRFFKTTLAPAYQAALRQKSEEIAAAGAVMRGAGRSRIQLSRLKNNCLDSL